MAAGTVHASVRDLLSEQVDRDHKTLLEWRKRAKEELGITGIVVVAAMDDCGNVAERHYLSERFWKRRAALMEKNDSFQNLSLRYVSGEHPGDITQPSATPDG